MNLKRRVVRLEKELNVSAEVRRLRIVSTRVMGVAVDGDGPRPSSEPEEPLGLRSCDRYFRNGWIFETVWINGSDEKISDEEMDRFVESFPINGMPANQKFRVVRGLK
jgi:hypothetical protein